MKARLHVINLGAGKASLSTVGYTLYTRGGAVAAARTTSGVFEVGTATGIYAASITLDDGFDGIVLWDTGDASVRYGVEETLSQLFSIQNETDDIRIIWNSLKNQGELYATLLRKLNAMKGSKPPKEYDTILQRILELLQGLDARPASPTAEALREALTVTVTPPEVPAPVVHLPAPQVHVPAPIVQIPETVIPDYTGILQELRTAIARIRIPDHAPALATLDSRLTRLHERLMTLASGTALKTLSEELTRVLTETAAAVRQALTDHTSLDHLDELDRILTRLASIREDGHRRRQLADLGVS